MNKTVYFSAVVVGDDLLCWLLVDISQHFWMSSEIVYHLNPEPYPRLFCSMTPMRNIHEVLQVFDKPMRVLQN